MAIPTATDDTTLQRKSFAAVRELADQCRQALPPSDAAIFDTLSMGMTGDLSGAEEVLGRLEDVIREMLPLLEEYLGGRR